MGEVSRGDKYAKVQNVMFNNEEDVISANDAGNKNVILLISEEELIKTEVCSHRTLVI